MARVRAWAVARVRARAVASVHLEQSQCGIAGNVSMLGIVILKTSFFVQMPLLCKSEIE